jgi:hypothetical protein
MELSDLSTGQGTTTAPASAEAAALETTNPVPAEKKPEQFSDPRFAENMARIARRERALREKESSYQSQAQKLKEYEETERLREDDPLAYLEKKGLTYDQISRRILDNPIDPTQKELAEIKKKMQAFEQEKVESLKRNEEQKLQESFQSAKRELDNLITSNADKYELITLNESQDLVFQVIHEAHKAHDKWLTFEEAADKVEQHLESKLEKILEAKKVKSRFPQPQPKIEETQPETQAQFNVTSIPHGERTLSNIGAQTTRPNSPERVSDEELLRRALAVMKSS